jgi:hypothetical protein
LYERVYEKSKIKMKAYTAVQKKLLEFIFVLWKKDEAFDPNYQDKKSRDVEPVPSFASVPQEPSTAYDNKEKELKLTGQKITPAITRVTQDKHPSKYRRMPSFA